MTRSHEVKKVKMDYPPLDGFAVANNVKTKR
jgi:hypothetical protein